MENLARCVGLWLAEGDNKTKSEVTFTNNNFDLVRLFYKTMKENFPFDDLNPRIYVYSPNGEKPKIDLDVAVRYYLDRRANFPYFIFRVASVELVKKWHKVVEDIKGNTTLYQFILQGFFAGEGNIKYNINSHSRAVRIAQGKVNLYLEKILNSFDVTYKYSEIERVYVISNIINIIKLGDLGIADLHNKKKLKFEEMIVYSEIHYPRNLLKSEVFKILKVPHTARQLSLMFDRSLARLQDVLIDLKKENKIRNYRVKSKDYWIRDDQRTIIISKVKEKLLHILKGPMTTADIARLRHTRWQTTFKSLKGLEKLGLIMRMDDKVWKRISANQKIIIF